MKNTNTETSLEDVLLSVRDIMTKELISEAKKLGFSLTHFEILHFIAENITLTMKEVAEKLHITPPSASVLVDTLVQKGLVERKNDEEDRRTIHITLTPETYKLFIKIHKNKEHIFKTMLSKLDDNDKKELMRILNKCTN